MNIKDFQRNVAETKNLPFLIGFLNHCKLSAQPNSSEVPAKVDNLNIFGGELYNTQEQNIINTSDTVSKDSTREKLDNSFKNMSYFGFVNLMVSDSGFGNSMRGVVDAYSSNNPPRMDLLKAVIDNNTKTTFDNIFRRVQNGENLTGQDINNLIESGLASNSKSINDEMVLLANAPFKISKEAIEQRMKGIRWQPIKGGSLPLEDIEKIKKITQQIKTTIEQSKTQLNVARNIVQLLRVLETIYARGYIGILQQIAKKFFSFVRDIGSIGFYVLNMFEPYRLEDGTVFSIPLFNGNEDKDEIEKLGEKEKLLAKISREKILSDYEYLLNDFKSATPYISNYTIEDFNKLKDTKEYSKTSLEERLKKMSTFYRPTTYASFIRTIADAFLDEADLPRRVPTDKTANFSFGNEAFGRKVSKGGYIKNAANETKKDFRPGRPIFSDTSSSTVMILAFSIPDIVNLADTGGGIILAIWYFLSGLSNENTKNPDIVEWFINSKNAILKSLFKKSGEEADKVDKVLERHGFLKRKKKLYDYLSKPPYVNDQGEIELPDDNSQYPDFFGLSLRQAFPSLFQEFDELEAELNKWTKEFKGSISKSLNKLLNIIEDTIDDLEDFIDLLDSIISFFEALQTMGLYKLQITSNGGNQDIVEKLLAAEGFPGVEEGDKLRWIGGFVICYGYPSPNLNGFDLINFVKQKSALINYQAQVEKFAVTDDPEDDPGSFEDYMFEENIYGFDYNSSSDKIFKKLF